MERPPWVLQSTGALGHGGAPAHRSTERMSLLVLSWAHGSPARRTLASAKDAHASPEEEGAGRTAHHGIKLLRTS